jgi:uncharacterized membrane protein (TIGR02234 family)
VTHRPDPAEGAHPRSRAGRRRLVLVCLALVAGAAALEAAARLGWFTASVDVVGRAGTVTATGADLVPGLSGIALLALAAVAAAVAVAGLPRRVLGALVAAAGGYVGVMVVRLLVSPPSPADLADLPGAPAGGTAVAGSVTSHPGPLLAALGGVLLIAAGAVLVVADRRLPRLGARYSARPEQAATDPDRATWEALDAGVDPTVEAGDAGAGRSDGGGSGGNV